MAKYEVDFCERPTWWPFINAFRYAIARPNALANIENWLLANFSIIDHKATYLNQMIQDGSYAVELDCYELHKKSIILAPADVYNKIIFINKVIKMAKDNNIALSKYSESCLISAKEIAKMAGICWENEETEAKQE